MAKSRHSVTLDMTQAEDEEDGTQIKDQHQTNNSTSDVSIEEMKFLEAMRLLGIQPKLDSPEDLLKLRQAFGGVKSEEGAVHEEQVYAGARPKERPKYDDPYRTPSIRRSSLEEGPRSGMEYDGRHETPHGRQSSLEEGRSTLQTPRTESKGGHYSFPRLSLFYGEDGKGEVNWQTFQYEVDSLVAEGVFSEQQILLGIRRSLKGSASDVVRRLGPGVTIQQVIAKLDSAYGSVESRESIMKKFYTCTQKSGEPVEVFASRLEELFGQAVNLGALRRSDMLVLKEKLYGGLRSELRQPARYQYDKIQDYDAFKRELRKLEAELKENDSPERRPSKAVVSIEKENPEMTKMRELLEKLNARIDVLEQEKENNQQYRISGFRGRGRGSQYNPGRGAYRPQRPTGGTMFQPTCYHCNTRGHLRRDCPQLASEVICYKCNEPGHFQRNCPKE